MRKNGKLSMCIMCDVFLKMLKTSVRRKSRPLVSVCYGGKVASSVYVELYSPHVVWTPRGYTSAYYAK